VDDDIGSPIELGVGDRDDARGEERTRSEETQKNGQNDRAAALRGQSFSAASDAIHCVDDLWRGNNRTGASDSQRLKAERLFASGFARTDRNWRGSGRELTRRVMFCSTFIRSTR
jgi:hypothetical protein